MRSARAARPGKQDPQQCLEVWSCLPLRSMAESSATDFTVGLIQKDWGLRVAKIYGQQKRNIIHTSSTAYEQDHSAAAPLSSVMNSRRLIQLPRRRGRARSRLEVPLRGKTMPTKHRSGTGSSAHRVEISHLVHVYGVTRDQARRLLSKIGNDRAKLGEAARILKARLPSRSVPEAK